MKRLDDPEEEAEYDQPRLRPKVVKRLEPKPAVVVSKLPPGGRCLRCDKGPGCHRKHDRDKRGCALYVGEKDAGIDAKAGSEEPLGLGGGAPAAVGPARAVLTPKGQVMSADPGVAVPASGGRREADGGPPRRRPRRTSDSEPAAIVGPFESLLKGSEPVGGLPDGGLPVEEDDELLTGPAPPGGDVVGGGGDDGSAPGAGTGLKPGVTFYPLGQFRRDLQEAQQVDPYCREVIAQLRCKGSRGALVGGAEAFADPNWDAFKAKIRAEDFRLDERDGLLLRVLEGGVRVPVIPKSRCRGAALGVRALPASWAEMITQDAHESLVGGHQSAKDMYHPLRGQVWWEGKRGDCRRC